MVEAARVEFAALYVKHLKLFIKIFFTGCLLANDTYKSYDLTLHNPIISTFQYQ